MFLNRLFELSIKNKYLLYSGLTTYISSCEYVLSTHSMLSAVSCESNQLNMSMNFIGKDIIGQLGSLYIINSVSKYSDKNPMKFLKYSILTEQVSIFVESLTPIVYPELFIPIGACSNIGKSVSMVGIGSLNVKVINVISTNNNVGETYSKITSVNTIASSLGMMTGLAITTAIPCHHTRLCLIPVLGILRYLSLKQGLSLVLK
jgi:hypothetical protein